MSQLILVQDSDMSCEKETNESVLKGKEQILNITSGVFTSEPVVVYMGGGANASPKK